MSEHKNPYRSGSYHQLFQFMQKKQVYTRQELMDFEMKVEGLTETQASANVLVLNSPRESSKRGDCRGNISAHGELHYSQKLAREVKAGVKGVQKFRLRWRTTPLEARRRVEKIEVAPAKTIAKVDTKVDPVVTVRTAVRAAVKA